MIYEKIKLNDEGALLEVFAAEKVGEFVRGALLVIPGGGYSCVCADREGEPIALAFMPKGYNSFVLHYSVNKKPFPSHLIEAATAIKYIRDNAERYNVDPERVFAVGFSAGGHLCASLATMWNLPEIYEETGMPFGACKPNGAMLIYPVISSDFHCVSFANMLMKSEITAEDKKRCDIEKNVSADTAPIFIVHTSNDQVVDVRNSLLLANALKAAGKTFEMHIYPDAPHGIALGNEITKCGNEKWVDTTLASWVDDACEWAERFGEK